MSLNDLVRKFRRAEAAGPEDKGKQAFEWEPEKVMPAVEPRPRAARRHEEEAPAVVAVAPSPSRRPASHEPSSVVGATIPADVADFTIVYKGAAVQAPAHGYGVDRVAEMLAHKSLAGLDKAVKASAVLAALDAAGVNIAEVIDDGVVRYKALLAFEAAKELELQQTRPRNERRVEDLKAGVESFQKRKLAEIDVLSRESAAAAAALTRLETRQRAEEERFHRTVSLFVEPLPGRVLPMTARPAEPAPAAEAKPPAPTLAAVPSPAKAEAAPAAPAKEEAAPAASAPEAPAGGKGPPPASSDKEPRS